MIAHDGKWSQWSALSLEDSCGVVVSEIENVQWFGPDADAYRDAHLEAIRADLTSLGERLRSCRVHCDEQAEEQEVASRVGAEEGCFASVLGGIGEFVGGVFVDGLWGTIVSMWEGLLDLPRMAGFDESWNWSWENLAAAWAPLGPFVSYNPETGAWGDWGVMGDAWWGQVKDFLAWDMWGENWPRALGQVVWNIGSCFIGIGIIKRIANILKTGRAGRGGSDGDASPEVDRTPDEGAPGSRYGSGDPSYPGEHPPRRPSAGDTDGGPGRWAEVNRRPGRWQEYQEQISGVQGDPGRPFEYRIELDGDFRDFDGRVTRGEPPQEVYLEAKGESPQFLPENDGKPWAAIAQDASIKADIRQIRDQRSFIPADAKLEWHVENPIHAEMLRNAAVRAGLDVEIVFTPRV